LALLDHPLTQQGHGQQPGEKHGHVFAKAFVQASEALHLIVVGFYHHDSPSWGRMGEWGQQRI
jgi:hypothetical protein